MLHMIRFRDGRAEYRNRFVRTDGLRRRATRRATRCGAASSAAPTQSLREDGWGARTRMKDASSTDVVVHAGRALTSFYQCGDLYGFDPRRSSSSGRETWNGKFPRDWGISAHTKVDEHTGEMLVFNYAKTAPYMHYGVVDADNELVHWIDVPLPGPRLPHDMAFTEHYAILNDCPLFWDADLLAQGRARAAVPPRPADALRGRSRAAARTGDIRWFEADPTYVLHWTNAYEDGDEIVLDGFFQGDPMPRARRRDRSLPARVPRHRHAPHADRAAPLAVRTSRPAQRKEETLSDRIMEFPMINAQRAGRPYRYTYNMTTKPGWFLFDGIVKLDLETGAEERYAFGDGVFGSETPMAPRVGATAEDDGYLVTFTTDMNARPLRVPRARRRRHHRRPDRARPPPRAHLAAAPTRAGRRSRLITS